MTLRSSRIPQFLARSNWPRHRCAPVCFCVIGLRDADDLARIVDNGMLKSAAGAKKRHAIDPCEPNREQSTFHAGVRTARHAPQAVEIAQLLTRSVSQSGRRKPSRLDLIGVQGCRSEFERARNCGMREDLSVIVAD